MELSQFFKSIIDQDTAPVIICDLEHTIIYMNSAADKSYEKSGGNNLTGKSLLLCHNDKSVEMIKKVVEWFSNSECNNIVHTFYNEKHNRDVYMIALRDENNKLIGYYEKHEYRNKDNTPFYDLGE